MEISIVVLLHVICTYIYIYMYCYQCTNTHKECCNEVVVMNIIQIIIMRY